MPTFEFTSPEGKTYSVDGPEGATKEQAFQILQQHLGGAAPAAPQVGLGEDVAKSGASGLAKGTATVLGLPGDLATLAHAVAPQSVIDKVKAIPGAKALYNHLPGSQAVLNSADDPSLANYEPQTAAGRYTKAVAAGAGPGLVSGMGVPATLAGAVAGQGAYDLTGSHLAEAGANLGASILTPLALARYGRQFIRPDALKDASAVKAEANAGYATPEIRDTAISQRATSDLADAMRQELANSRSKFTPAGSAGDTFSSIDNLVSANAPKSGIGPSLPTTIEDLHLLRKDLGKASAKTQDFKPTEAATAAGTAKRVLDKYLDNLPSRDVVSGDPIDAVAALRAANANWRYQNSASKIGNIIQKATDKAGSQASGLNYGNLQRQGLLPLLDNDAAKLKQMGFGAPDDIDAVRTAVQGDINTNLLRKASNMLGGGGGIASTGIGALTGGGEGYREHGWLGGVAGTLAGAAAGQTLRMLANARSRNAAKAIQDAILAKAPANASIVARNNAAQATNAANISQAVGRNGIPNGLLQALMLAKYGGNGQ